MDGLYKLKLDINFSASLMCVHQNIGIKRSMANENSTYLWHKRFGHISKERLQRLVKNEILPNLEFTDLGYEWIALRESKPNITRKETQEVISFLK